MSRKGPLSGFVTQDAPIMALKGSKMVPWVSIWAPKVVKRLPIGFLDYRCFHCAGAVRSHGGGGKQIALYRWSFIFRPTRHTTQRNATKVNRRYRFVAELAPPKDTSTLPNIGFTIIKLMFCIWHLFVLWVLPGCLCAYFWVSRGGLWVSRGVPRHSWEGPGGIQICPRRSQGAPGTSQDQ